MDYNLRHLRAVAETVRSGSVSAAAQRVALTQPALTQAIAGVERQLGVPLFERHGGGMRPTDAATVLTPRIEAALRHIGSPRVTAAQFRALLAVADAGSYAGASAATGLAQPSLHRAIGDLSAALRRVLVVRSGRGITLTEPGRRTTRAFRLARAELVAGLSEVSALQGRETGRVAIGAMPLSRARILPRAVADFTRLHPEATVAIAEGSHAELVEPLRDGVLDLLIGALRDAPDPDLAQHPLFEDRPVVIARAGHPLAGTAPSVEALASYPWIVAGPGTPLAQQWARLFDEAGVPRPAAPIECGSVITIRQILRESDFLTLLSPDQVAVEIDDRLLTVVGEAPPSLKRIIGITTRRDWQPTPLQRAFQDLIVAQTIPEKL
jgi:DNA-binding transcriptional LysR family regulator